MIEWVEPKTDWQVRVNSKGQYEGDYFNATDFNRIKNNIQVLVVMANDLYSGIEVQPVAPDKTVRDYLHASDINNMLFALLMLNFNTLKLPSNIDMSGYVDNGRTMTFSELNEIETLIGKMREVFMNMLSNRRMFVFNLGESEGL